MQNQHLTRVFFGPTELINGPFVAVAIAHYKESTQRIASMVGGCTTLERAAECANDLAAQYGVAPTEAVIR